MALAGHFGELKERKNFIYLLRATYICKILHYKEFIAEKTVPLHNPLYHYSFFNFFQKHNIPLQLFHADRHSSVPGLFIIFRSVPFRIPAHEKQKKRQYMWYKLHFMLLLPPVAYFHVLSFHRYQFLHSISIYIQEISGYLLHKMHFEHLSLLFFCFTQFFKLRYGILISDFYMLHYF